MEEHSPLMTRTAVESQCLMKCARFMRLQFNCATGNFAESDALIKGQSSVKVPTKLSLALELVCIHSNFKMAEVGWDEVTYLRKKPQRAAEARSQKVS